MHMLLSHVQLHSHECTCTCMIVHAHTQGVHIIILNDMSMEESLL